MTIDLSTLKQQLLMERLAAASAQADSPMPVFAALFGVLGLSNAVDERCAELLAGFGLSEGRFAVLLLLEKRQLERQPAMNPAEIAENLGVTRATVTGLIAGLEQQALLTREADASDGRRARLSLTAAGAAVIAEVLPMYSHWLGGAMRGVSAADAETFAAVLAQMANNLTGDGARS